MGRWAVTGTAALLLGCTPPAEPPPRDDPSLSAFFAEDISGGDLTRGTAIDADTPYTSHHVTFRSGDLTISGVLSVPAGQGPFPAVVLNHGHIPPRLYQSGEGTERERDYLARAGFVVLHPDFRGHAESSPASAIERELRLGYALDAIAAVKALRELPEVRDDQVAMAGRSGGGAVTLSALVVEPDLVDVAVVWAAASSRYDEYFDRWTRTTRPEVAREVLERWGSVEENPDFWAGLSARTYFDRVEATVMIHHGTHDERCPLGWARDTDAALREAGVDVRFHVYRGEEHVFTGDWKLSMRRTVEFLRAEMSVP